MFLVEKWFPSIKWWKKLLEDRFLRRQIDQDEKVLKIDGQTD
jgi:hypothetical protein